MPTRATTSRAAEASLAARDKGAHSQARRRFERKVGPVPVGGGADASLAFLLSTAVRALLAAGGHPRSIPGIAVRPGLLQPFAKEVLKPPLRGSAASACSHLKKRPSRWRRAYSRSFPGMNPLWSASSTGRCTSWSAGKPPGAALTPPRVLDVEVSGMPEETGR
jgi:hypothetical protein